MANPHQNIIFLTHLNPEEIQERVARGETLPYMRDKRFQCEKCAYCCISKRVLAKHQATVHTDEDGDENEEGSKKMRQTKLCGKRFSKEKYVDETCTRGS